MDKPKWHEPYSSEIDFVKEMTPIEFDTWQVIRILGVLPLYPQYPIGSRFTDFGNPFFKIAIECDGKDFHNDKRKDRLRDQYFKDLGYTVYRISGADCRRIINNEFDSSIEEHERLNLLSIFYDTTVDGLIKALAIKHCKLKVTYGEYKLSLECLRSRVTNNTETWQHNLTFIDIDEPETLPF